MSNPGHGENFELVEGGFSVKLEMIVDKLSAKYFDHTPP
mgnify:CR=1 FL=1